MRKIIAAINMTVDGFCDHTAMIADNDEILQHYTDLLKNADTYITGRITYELMEYWETVVKNPTGKKPIDEFAATIDSISKIVFSHTLKNVEWKNAKLAKSNIKEEVLELKQQGGKDIIVGSRSLIVSLLNLHLVDELQLCIHPVVARHGLPLFKNISGRTFIKLVKAKSFDCGAVTLYYDALAGQ